MPVENPAQVPMTTPPFLPGSVPGIGGSPSSVPGQDAVTDKTNSIIKALLQAATRKQMANTAVPMQIPGREDPNAARNIGMNTAWPSAWGTQRFLGTLGSMMKNAVIKQKEDQLLKAEGDWTYLQSSMNELFEAQQGGDQNAVAAAQRKVDVILGDPKKLKNMAKALNQDWLNPEKTTVYGEALKKVSAQGQQRDAQKSQAAQGIRGIIQKLLGDKQKVQLTADQQRKMIEEIQGKAPTTPSAISDPKTMIELQRLLGEQQLHKEEIELEKRGQDLRERELAEARQERSEEKQATLKYQYDKLGADLQAKSEALQEKKVEAKDRMAMQQGIFDLRRDQLEFQRELAEEKLQLAKNTKERQTWINGVRSDLQKQLVTAQKNMHLWGIVNAGAYEETQSRIQKLDELSSQIADGTISPTEATQAIYGQTPNFVPVKK